MSTKCITVKDKIFSLEQKTKIISYNRNKTKINDFDDLIKFFKDNSIKFNLKFDKHLAYRIINDLFSYKNYNTFRKKSESVKRVYEILISLKDYAKYGKYWNDFLKEWINFVIDYISNVDYDKFLDDKQKNRNWLKIERELKKTYKRNNLLYPHKKVNKRLDDYTLKDGLLVKPLSNSLHRIYKCEKIIAFDTETYEGKCRLICDSLNRELYFDNINDNKFFEIINFLMYYIDKPNIYRFFFNIDFDVQSILKHLDYETNKQKIDYLSKGIPVIFKKYEITWIRSKLFSIRDLKRKKVITFTDLYTFYNLGLGKAGKEYLNDTKLDIIDSKQLNDNLEYWNNNLDDIIKYCIKDCILTKDLGWILIDSIKKCNLKLPKLLVSPASISKANFRYNKRIPSIKNNVSMKLVQIAYDCYYGGRFELFKRGTFKKAWLFDINSQYPAIIKDLPDMSKGIWSIYRNLKELPKSKTFGYFKCYLKIEQNQYISMIPNRNGIVRFYNGYAIGWFTWFDLDLMRDYIVNIKKAYIFESNYPEYPFREKVIKYYKQKAELKNGSKMMYNTVKICLNGIYGCFIERQERYYLDNDGNIQKKLVSGVLFNSIYASQITSYGRWSVIKSIPKKEWNSLIAIHTDSIATNKDVSKYLNIGKELGQWSLEGKGKAIFINTGFYQIGKGKKKILKTRGIPKKEIKDLFKFCKKNKNLSEKEFIIKHMKKIREAIIQDKNLVNMNKMIDIKKSVSANSDSKRHWIRDFKDFNDLRKNNIDSLPFYNFKQEFELESNPIIISKQLNIDVKYAKFILKNQDIY